MFAVLVAFTSCKKDEVGETATKALAGEWIVVFDGVDASGNVVAQDPYEMGKVRVLTYNTAKNVPTEIFLDDLQNFWEFKVQLSCDISALTFSGENVQNEYYDSTVSVTDGKVVIGGTLSPSGTAVDAIEFKILLSDDDNAGVAYDRLYAHGYRYTGLATDD